MTMEKDSVVQGGDAATEKLVEQWDKLKEELDGLEKKHAEYLSKRHEVQEYEASALKRMKKYKTQLFEMKKSLKPDKSREQSDKSQNMLSDLDVETADASCRIIDMIEELPRESNGLYLSVILGSVDVSILSKAARFRYKDEYEKFKEVVVIISVVALILARISQQRFMDAIWHFLLVWYYCTLTIRESILRVNGSRVKGWWLAHHYISTVLCGIALTWPAGATYQAFNDQFNLFSLYMALVQLGQCYYQRSCLRRLYSLGQRHVMDVTVDGFHSWMFKGLTFLLPFLIVGYIWQLYNAYTLFVIYFTYESAEWQVFVLAALFLLVCVGNSMTTARVCLAKAKDRNRVGVRRRLQTKYSIANTTHQHQQ